MSKAGRRRRTPEQRIKAKDDRSTLAYIRRIQQEVGEEQFQKAVEAFSAGSPVTAEQLQQIATLGETLGIKPESR